MKISTWKMFFAPATLFLGSILLAAAFLFADVIPSDRLVTWQGNVGVEGGIPIRTAEVNCTLAPYNAHADGVNTAANIQACLDGIDTGQVAYLPAGTYSLASTLSIPSNKTLRGAGPGATILLFTADLSNDIRISQGNYTDITNVTGISIVSGCTKGSNQLVLSDASGFAPGNFVYISELNDPAIPVVITNTNGTCNWCGVYGSNGTRARLQLTKVTAVNGAAITINPPMYFTFASANTPLAHKAPNYVQYAGIENLTIKNAGTALTATRKPVVFQGAANSWVKNVTLDNAGKRGVDLWFDVFRNEIRDCWFTNVIDQSNSDNYALQIEAGSGNLVENNIFDNTANGIILVSASGNVFGYNYMHGVHRTAGMTTWFWPDTWTHGSHSSYNLWEGNDATALEWDFYWGSNSHDMAFRNRFHGKDTTINYDVPNLQTSGAVLTFPDNNYMSEICNVLGTSGFENKYEDTAYGAVRRPIWVTVNSAFGVTSNLGFATTMRHMNYDYFTNSTKHCGDPGEPGCQGGDGGTTLPVSLYLLAKPLWFGSVVYPPIGPDVTGLANKIPAQLRFEGLSGIIKSPNLSSTFCSSLMLTSLTPARITFLLPQTSHVKLEVFGGAGKLIKALVGNRQEAGIHTVSWNAKELSSGVYICRLTSGGLTVAKKYMLR